MTASPARSSSASRIGSPRGFTLVELLVAVAIALALTLAITLMMIRSESGRRSLTSVNEVAMGGGYLSYTLDRSIRSAGSGFTERWTQSFGCLLNVSRSGTQLLPRTSAFPTPFNAVPQQVRLAPAIIHAGAGTGGSDVLRVQSGSSGLGEIPLRILPGSSMATEVKVPATVGMRAGDLMLVAQDGTTCMVQQVDSGFVGGADQRLPFSGAYAQGVIAGVSLVNMGATNTAWLAPLGNVAGNQPAFQLIGVGADNTLVTLDMLRLDGSDAAVPVADGVVNLRALYGVDTDDDGVIDAWVSPAAAPWDATTLLNGSSVSQRSLRRILALRVGLVMRNSSPERVDVAPASLQLFSDLGGALVYTHNIAAGDRTLRHRSIEFTVPLRNVMLAPQS